MSMDYIELTTLLVAIIGLGALIVHNLAKLIRATEKQTAQFETFSTNCTNKFDDIDEVLEEYGGYLKDHDMRIYKLEEK